MDAQIWLNYIVGFFCILVLILEHASWEEGQKEGGREGRREGEKGGGEGREYESQADSKHGTWCRARSYDPRIMTWPKIKSHRVNQQSHLGAPKLYCRFLVSIFFIFKQSLWSSRRKMMKGKEFTCWLYVLGKVALRLSGYRKNFPYHAVYDYKVFIVILGLMCFSNYTCAK